MLAHSADHISKFGTTKDDDHLLKKTNQYFKSTVLEEIRDFKVFQDYDQNYSWLQLFAKLDFEHYIQMIPQHADLGTLHKYIHAVAPYMTNLYIKTQNKRKLKSGYYYWMIIMGRLKNLQVLTIDDMNQGFFYQIQKYLVKGFKYFKENGGSLKKFKL